MCEVCLPQLPLYPSPGRLVHTILTTPLSEPHCALTVPPKDREMKINLRIENTIK